MRTLSPASAVWLGLAPYPVFFQPSPTRGRGKGGGETVNDVRVRDRAARDSGQQLAGMTGEKDLEWGSVD